MSGDRYTIKNSQATHFVTFVIVGWVDLFIRPVYKNIIVDALNYCIKNKGLVVYGWVIMTSHIHLLITAKENYVLPDIIRDYKKFTSKQLTGAINEISESRKLWMLNRFRYEVERQKRSENVIYKVWKAGYYGIECDQKIDVAQKLDYIHNNPVKQIIVGKPVDYIYSSASAYAGEESLVNIEFI